MHVLSHYHLKSEQRESCIRLNTHPSPPCISKGLVPFRCIFYDFNNTTSLSNTFPIKYRAESGSERRKGVSRAIVPVKFVLVMARNYSFRHNVQTQKCRCSRPYGDSVVTIGGRPWGTSFFRGRSHRCTKRQKNRLSWSLQTTYQSLCTVKNTSITTR